jgi:hypothetical protein
MSNKSFSPKFVKGNITLKIDTETYPVGEQLLNASGVAGFAWNAFDPLETIGKPVEVIIEVLCSQPYQLDCKALLTCERTEKSIALGLDFILTPSDTAVLNGIIAKEGVLPEFVRKFPRIHFNPHVGIMPSRVILRTFQNGNDVEVVTDLDNISPSGLQVFTEDSRIALTPPGEVVRVSIQPRGEFLMPIHLTASVKRVIESVTPVTGNRRWFFGLNTVMISDESKPLFTDLLKRIVLSYSKK